LRPPSDEPDDHQQGDGGRRGDFPSMPGAGGWTERPDELSGDYSLGSSSPFIGAFDQDRLMAVF
jgi:hypothetical protein